MEESSYQDARKGQKIRLLWDSGRGPASKLLMRNFGDVDEKSPQGDGSQRCCRLLVIGRESQSSSRIPWLSLKNRKEDRKEIGSATSHRYVPQFNGKSIGARYRTFTWSAVTTNKQKSRECWPSGKLSHERKKEKILLGG